MNTWEKYCLFTELDTAGFLQLQRELMMEQVEKLQRCEMGRHFLGHQKISTLEDFLSLAPLTTYEEYVPFFGEKKDEYLPEKPRSWAFTAGKNGSPKWIPFTDRMYEELKKNAMACIHLSSMKTREDFNFNPGDVMFYAFAPPPYLTGYMAHAILNEFDFTFAPPVDEAETMDFKERLYKGFGMALKTGLSGFMGLSSVLLKMGEEFKEKFGILPREKWQMKGIVAYGLDSSIYAPQIRHFWGRTPLEVHAASEVGIISTQTMDHQGLTLFPNAAFYEFIPERELYKERKNSYYRPKTKLINEVIPGERYELVLTSLFGGGLIRYRVGHLIKVLRLSSADGNIKLPQIAYESRADDAIDLSGFTRMTERTIWQALVSSHIPFKHWGAVREHENGKPVLHLLIEGSKTLADEDITDKIHLELCRLDPFYADLETMLDQHPLRVTLLESGAFKKCLSEMGVSDNIQLPRMKLNEVLVKELTSVKVA